MFGRRKDNDGTAKTGTDAPVAAPAATDSSGPRMYRADSAMAPVPRAPVVEAPRRAPDVTASTGRRSDIRPSAPGDSDSKKLIVGRDIALSGEIRACDRLVVEGRVEATLSDSRSIEIAASGVFKGKAQIETAEVSGSFEGDLVVSQKLIIHSTGRVQGNIRYGEIEIARGGVIAGQIDVLAGGAPSSETASAGNGADTAATTPAAAASTTSSTEGAAARN
jgi:cytoskeletal protein CcmA (bactofilin family)